MDKSLLVERAKIYIKMLNEGIHPISGQAIPQDSVFMDEKIKKCFSFIYETLDEYLELASRVESLEKEKEKNTVIVLKKESFSITQEQCNEIKLSQKPITTWTLMKNINSVIDSGTMEKLSLTRVNKWLFSRGLVTESKVKAIVNRTHYKPSESAERIGITENEYIDAKSGEVKKQIMLDEKAQLFIIENLKEIIETTK